MIYTVTLNPSLDYYLKIEEVEIGAVNRSSKEAFFAGGKGINVSAVLGNFGMKSVALGFTGGFVGDEIKKVVARYKNVQDEFISINGLSRINIKLLGEDTTEINAAGPVIDDSELEELFKKISKIGSGDIVVLSGSIPASVGDEIYCKITEIVKSQGAKTVVDTSGVALNKAVTKSPMLIKPNLQELEEVCGKKAESIDDIVEMSSELRRYGAKDIMVSMGEKGAVFVCDEFCGYIKAPCGKVKNTTGAGDSMVAGYLASITNQGSKKEAFKLAVAAGSATAFSSRLATKDEIIEVYKKVSDVVELI